MALFPAKLRICHQHVTEYVSALVRGWDRQEECMKGICREYKGHMKGEETGSTPQTQDTKDLMLSCPCDKVQVSKVMP